MDNKDFRINMEQLSDEQNEQLTNILKQAERRRRNSLPESTGKKIGIIVLSLSALIVLFCMYLLLFGGKAEGICTKSPRTVKHHYDCYTYTVDGKEYWTTFNMTQGKPVHLGKEKTIRYLPAAPSVTFDFNLLILALITAVFGMGFLMLSGDQNIGGTYELPKRK